MHDGKPVSCGDPRVGTEPQEDLGTGHVALVTCHVKGRLTLFAELVNVNVFRVGTEKDFQFLGIAVPHELQELLLALRVHSRLLRRVHCPAGLDRQHGAGAERLEALVVPRRELWLFVDKGAPFGLLLILLLLLWHPPLVGPLCGRGDHVLVALHTVVAVGHRRGRRREGGRQNLALKLVVEDTNRGRHRGRDEQVCVWRTTETD